MDKLNIIFIYLIFSIFYLFYLAQARSVSSLEFFRTGERGPATFLPDKLKLTSHEEMERRKVSNTDPFEAAEGMLRWNSDIIKDKEIKQFKGLKKPLKLSENQNDEYDVDPFEAVTDWLPLNKNVDKT
ncbi:hypothetical protein ACQ4LE_008324 [Meloidogyne hapla]